MRRQIAPHIAVLCTAVIGVALLAGAGPASAQHPADASSLEVFGFELAESISAGDVEEMLARSTTSEYTCPAEPELPQPACEGQAAGTVVKGYWFGPLGAEWALWDRATFAERLSADVGIGMFDGARVRLATVSGDGVAICGECSQLVFTSVATEEAAVGSPILTAAVRQTFDGVAIAAVGGGPIQHENQVAYLTGGRVGDATFQRVGPAPAPPDTGSGTIGSNEHRLGEVALFAATVGAVFIAGAFGLRRRG